MVLLDNLADLEEGVAPLQAHGLGLLGQGDDDAVVVRQDHDGLARKVGAVEPLAGRIEAVAVAQSVPHASYPKKNVTPVK